jgi:hypothetical protein
MLAQRILNRNEQEMSRLGKKVELMKLGILLKSRAE